MIPAAAVPVRFQMICSSNPERQDFVVFANSSPSRSSVPVVALRLPPANFSNRFAVKHRHPNYFRNITNLAIDSILAHDLSLNWSNQLTV